MRARAGRVSENPHLTAIFGDGSSRVLRIRRPGGTAVRVRTLIERSERAIAIRIARLLLAKASPFWRGAVARIATDGEHIARAVVSTRSFLERGPLWSSAPSRRRGFDRRHVYYDLI